MRIVSYKMELFEEGYVISNAGELWDCIPTQANCMRPPIRVNTPSMEDVDGYRLTDPVDMVCANIDWTTDCSEEFIKNYEMIMRGQAPNWGLVGIKINPSVTVFRYVNYTTGDDDSIYIKPLEYGRLQFEVDRKDGFTEKYLFRMEPFGDDDNYRIILTEYYSYGRRELLFGLNEKHRRLNSVIVTEYFNLT